MSSAVLHNTLISGINDADTGTDDYKASVYQLHSTSVRVSGLVLPKPKDPSLWPGGTDAYVRADRGSSVTSGNLKSWASTTLATLTELPKSLTEDSGLVVEPYFKEIVEYADMLTQNPGDGRVKDLLRNRVKTLSFSFDGYTNRTSALVGSLDSQARVFTADAAMLADIADPAIKTAGADKSEIVSLDRDIAELEHQIHSQVTAIVGGSFLTVMGLGIGALAIYLAPATSGVSLFLLIPAVVVTAARLALGMTEAQIGSSISTSPQISTVEYLGR